MSEDAGEENSLTVTQSGLTVTFTDPGAEEIQPLSNCVALAPQSVSCTASSPSFELRIELGPGDDTAVIGASVTAPTRWQQLATPSGERGPGDDTYWGGSGPDYFYGEEGSDSYRGNGGTDSVIYDVIPSPYSAGVSVSLDGLANDGLPGEGDNVRDDVERVIGGDGPDAITGGDGFDVLIGNGGADVIEGGAGGDVIYGDEEGCGSGPTPGGDTLDGGPGNDDLHGCAGNDTFREFLDRPRPDADVFDGGPGVDLLSFAGRTDAVVADLVDGEEGEGDEVIAVENLRGGNGSDRLGGNGGANVIEGGAGADVLRGGAGADVLRGMAGVDTLYGEADGDDLGGGDGQDAVLEYMTALSGVSVTLDAVANDGPLGERVDNVRPDVEVIGGGHGDDILVGAGGDETLLGNDGDDLLEGNGGDDSLAGLAGDDELVGGAGSDLLSGGDGDDLLAARDAIADAGIDCGPGVDFAEVDPGDPATVGCESEDPPRGDGGEPPGPGSGEPPGPGPPPAPAAPPSDGAGGGPSAAGGPGAPGGDAQRAAARAPASNEFRFGRLTKNRRRGTALLRVRVAGAGLVRLLGTKSVAGARRRAQVPGEVTLRVRPRGKALRLLARKGRARVRARVAFTPDGGGPRAKSKLVVLVKRPGGANSRGKRG